MTDTVDKIIIQSETQGVQQSTNDVQGLTKAMDGVTVASQNVEKSTGSIDSKFASLERRFGTTAGQAAQLAKVQQTVNAAVAANPALQDQANEVLAAATARYGKAAVEVEKLGAAHAGMSNQASSAFHIVRSGVEGLATGQPLLQVFTQQLNHAAYASTGPGGLSGAFGELAGKAIGLVSPFNVAIAGAVALAAAAAAAAVQYDKLQVSSQRAISGAGARTGTTTSDINAFVDKNTPSAFSGASLSQKESRALGEDLTKTGDIVISKLQSMSAAVVGFSNQTGQSMDESVKSFAKMGADPVRALDVLAGAFGPFSQNTRTLVEDMVAAGDKTLAWNAILSELGPTAKGTAGNMTTAEMAARGLVNVLQTAPKPTGLEKQLEDVRQKLDGAIEAANQFAEHGVAAPPEVSNSIAALNKQFEQLYARQQGVIGLKVSSTFDDIAEKSRVATEALIPQNAQLREMATRLNQLKAARDTGAGGPDNGAAITAQENLIAKTQEAKGEAERYNDRVKEISGSWGDVGQSTALALQSAQNQLPVIEAVGNGAKMAAQYTADYKNYMDQGKTATEAAALAASHLAASQAQATSAAREQLAVLQDQSAVASARNAKDAIAAQGQATLNGLIRQGVDQETAASVAAQQVANAQEAATTSVMKQVESLRDSTDMITATANGTEAATAAAIAYKNAMEAGASAAAAAALSAETIANFTAKAAAAEQQRINSDVRQQTEQQSSAILDSRGNVIGIKNAWGSDWAGTGGTSSWDPGGYFGNLAPNRTAGTSQGISDAATKAFASGGIDAAIAAVKNTKGFAGTIGGPIIGSEAAVPIDYNALFSQLDTLYGLKNSTTNDNGAKIANLQDEMAFVKSAPTTIESAQKLVDLQQSIDQLKNSTDQLNSTNQDLLSPYYSQDPRTSHIGFRSQGMATGGELTVPGGYSANDNMLAQIPVASGEIVSVRRPGQNLSGGSSSNITINLGGLTVNSGGPADTNAIGRTVYQAMQNATRQLQAAGR